MDHLASMVDLQRQMKTGGILPSGALDIIRTFLREQKDVRPALLLLDQIICGKVPATPDDVYQAAWLLARAFHAEADRLSALLVYNALIERAPFPQDRGLAWVERTGLLIELVVDDRIAESTDWRMGVSQALAALNPTPDYLPFRSTVEYMKLIHTRFGAMPGNLSPAYMAFVDTYENVPGARRNVLHALEFRYRMRSLYATGGEFRNQYEELSFLRRFHRLLPPVGAIPQFPNMPVNSSSMLRRLATLEATRGNSALYQAANAKAIALEQAQQVIDAAWGTSSVDLELGRPGHGASGPGTTPRIRLR
jgi:hypothetical protein